MAVLTAIHQEYDMGRSARVPNPNRRRDFYRENHGSVREHAYRTQIDMYVYHYVVLHGPSGLPRTCQDIEFDFSGHMTPREFSDTL